MRNKLLSLIEISNASLIFLMILALPCSLVYPGDSRHLMRTFLVVIPAAASHMGIKKQKHLISYLLLMAGTAALLFFLADDIPERIWLTAASLILFLIRIPARLNRSDDAITAPVPVEAILFVAFTIVGHFIDSPYIGPIAYRYLFVFLILLFFYLNLTRMDSFLQQNKEIANLPGRQILRTNRVMMSIFVLAALFSMILLPALGLDKVLLGAGDGLLHLIRMFFSLFPGGEAEEAVVETSQAVQGNPEPFMLPPAEDSSWIKAILDFLSWLLSIAVYIGCIAGLVFLIIQVFRRFYRPIQENNDRQEFIGEEDKADLTAREEKRSRRNTIFSYFQPDAHIRRIYRSTLKKKFAKKGGNYIPSKGASPSELEQGAGLSKGASLDALHELYEKARYSGSPCSREDVSRLKENGW